MKDSKPKRYCWWHKLLAIAGSLALFGLLLEAGLRLVGVSVPTATVLGTFFRYDSQTGWSGRPNARSHFQTASFSVDISHDADGLRACGLTTRIAEDRDGAERMCWMIGDSTTWGWGLRDDNHFVALLNRDAPPSIRFRNLGTPGYSTVQQYYRFIDLLNQGYRPDVVVICFNNNDHWDNQLLLDDDPPRPHARFTDEQLTILGPPVGRSWELEIGSFLKRHSLAVGFVSYHLQRARIARRTEAARRKAAQESASEPHSELPGAERQAVVPVNNSLHTTYPPSGAEEILVEVLGKFDAACRENRVELAVATEFDPDPLLLAACEKRNIRVLHTSSRYQRFLQSSEGATELFFPFDPHINARGHALFAEAVLEQLHLWHPEWRVLPERAVLASDPSAAPVLR